MSRILKDALCITCIYARRAWMAGTHDLWVLGWVQALVPPHREACCAGA